MKTGQMYINGKWINGKTTFTETNPSTGGAFGYVYQGEEEDIERAVSSARNAFRAWLDLGVTKRSQIIGRVVKTLIENYGQPGEATPLKSLIMSEMGKRLPEADIEVTETSDMLSFFVKEAPRLLEPKIPSLNQQLWSSKQSEIVFEPVGVVGIIKPWNYPLELPIWAIGPALVAGNTVIFKPSEYSSFVGLEIAKMFHEAGIPKGVFNVVTGNGETGKLLVKHSGVGMIAFTGSVQVGKQIAIECARHLKKISLELGGNDAAIVEPDVDLELAANGLVWGAFCNTGQVCVRIKRAFVNQAILGELTKRVIEKTNSLRKDIDFGPVVSELQLVTIEGQVNDAIRKGAKVLTGGGRIANERGFYFAPTVLTNIKPSMNMMREECFGPVLPIIPVDDTEEALKLANNSLYGLGASIWTSQLERGKEIAKHLDVGMVWINDVNVAFPESPWGGVKQSGPGVELSEWGLYEYVHKKHVNVELSSNVTRDWWFPYKKP